MLPVEYQLKNKELVKLWVEALRSGQYRQIADRLRRELDTGYGYCCLGVLCEIAKPLASEELLERKLQDDGYIPTEINKLLQQQAIDGSLIARFRELVVQMPSGNLTAVTILNDDLQMSFNEIADLLEQTHLKESQKVSIDDENMPMV